MTEPPTAEDPGPSAEIEIFELEDTDPDPWTVVEGPDAPSAPPSFESSPPELGRVR
jgi:hypothetical protein